MFTLFSRLKQCYQFVKYSCPLIFHRYHLDTFYCDECGPCWRNNCMTLMIKSTWQYTDSTFWEWPGSVNSPWASYQIRKIAGRACAGNAGSVFARRWIQRKPRVSDLGMHHGTCVRHMSWCMSGSLTRGGGENVPGIPGACAPAILRIWQETHGEGTTGPLFTKRTDVLPQNQGPFSVSYLFSSKSLDHFLSSPLLGREAKSLGEIPSDFGWWLGHIFGHSNIVICSLYLLNSYMWHRMVCFTIYVQ